MTSSPDDAPPSSADSSRVDRSAHFHRSWSSLWPVVLAVFLSFLASSAVRRPVPSVNEPHYLCKAKQYWQPEWCAGDLFLESSNPHLVFYQTIGVLTQWLSLEQTAWVGRVLAFTCLASGWTLLFSRLVEPRWKPLAAAWIFLLLQSLGNLSGEWLVGGVESKVFAYAFAFTGLASAIERRWILTGLWMGLSISFHPIVGLWCVVAGAISAVGWMMFARPTSAQFVSENGRSLIGCGILMLLVALPGLLPAVSLLSGTDPVLSIEADLLQVGTRLAHHLDPARFSVESYGYYGLMLILTILLWWRAQRTRSRDLFAGFVAATVVIAVVGALVGWGPRPLNLLPYSSTRVWLLKFYPFRLADLFVPVLLTVSVLAAVFEARSKEVLTSGRRNMMWTLCASAFVILLLLPTADQNPSRLSAAKRADWIAVCEWLRDESPTDSLLYAANENWAVKWFAHRAEYVNYKDCPQDAVGIIKWARRLRFINQWARESFNDGTCSTADLARLHNETGINYMIVSRFGPIDAEPIHSNDSFHVYEVGGQ